ncbi:esterase/lipase family protein [Amycolatopsis sp. H20-H5]|uniref:esterase/lipase family protein n=1 Tax=Amycolatopsis sp. H20-H5 TaxID=3046309 RepID=UPI002DBE57D5|nr:alpha/beta fold hydrolase [Amycolatopsis sp. H20-H5]MEC3977281.1 alpha/beta fold hydrolase [Amycolatopsis sp. H20-H5]
MRRWFPVAIALACGAATALFPGSASAAPAHDPVVFVHGYGGSAAEFSVLRQAFLDAGYQPGELYSLDFSNTQLNEVTAGQLAGLVGTALAETGRSKADLIGFSMGSLSSRYYLKNLGGTAEVAHFASIAGANHGTLLAYGCALITADQACPQLQPTSPLVLGVNSGDETPGPTVYGTWASPCDLAVVPSVSIRLAGADNHWTSCTDHVGTLANPAVQAQVVALFGT